MEKYLTVKQRNDAENAVRSLLEVFDLDEGEHTANTPARVVKAWEERLSGYRENPAEHLQRTFPAPDRPGLIIARRVSIQSTCAHHLLPIQGHATIAYRPQPGQPVVGLSKLSRVAQGYARRLQVQENITFQIVEAIEQALNPAWCGVSITATHGCMIMRGVKDECSDTVTYADSGEPTESDRQAFWAACQLD